MRRDIADELAGGCTLTCRRYWPFLYLEEIIGPRHPHSHPLVGSDSKVNLAALLKGRSSSPSINRQLTASLANHLGFELFPSFHYVQSAINVADDPTRHPRIRAPAKELPTWYRGAAGGDFRNFDEWLASSGFDPLRLAGFPAEALRGSTGATATALKKFANELREVQKPERLVQFDHVQGCN